MPKKRMAFQFDKCCWLAPAAFVFDRVTKGWAQAALLGNAPMDIWPGVLRLNYTENTGAAFSLFTGKPIFLLIVTGISLFGLLLWLLFRGLEKPALFRSSLWMLFGGAMGNFMDRLLLGYVIDFIEIRLFRFPIFNLADSFVFVAFVFLSASILFAKGGKTDG